MMKKEKLRVAEATIRQEKGSKLLDCFLKQWESFESLASDLETRRDGPFTTCPGYE